MSQQTNIREIVGRADLRIDGTVKRSEGGLPIGNGRMGTLVWTSPSALKMQVNRSDVYANNSFSNSFNERHYDYGYACGFVDIDLADYGADVFGPDTRQHLDLYRALGEIDGRGVKTQFFACEGVDAFAFRVEDERKDAESVKVKVKMLRPAEFRVKCNLAVSDFETVDDIVVLKQVFYEDNEVYQPINYEKIHDFKYVEDGHYCASAIAVRVVGRPTRIRYNNESGGQHPGIEGRQPIMLGQENETETRICLEPGPGEFEVYVASASTFDQKADVATKAVDAVRKASGMGWRQVSAHTEEVWKKFWNMSYIELWGDEEAKLVEQHYQYFMYIMGCCSRNSEFAPNFGGLLFSPRGDYRHWGTMQWGANLSIYYNPIMTSGHYELAKPYFNHYFNMRERLAVAAKQQWDAEGIYIPEVVGFDGPEVLPDDIAKELSDLLLVRKPWEEHSDEFWKFAFNKRPHESRWNFKTYEAWQKGYQIIKDRGIGAFGPVTHMFDFAVRYCFVLWEYYQHSGDIEFFRERAYPMIKGVCQFFHTFPNLKKDEDGLYHVYYTNCGEGFYGSKDSMGSMISLYGIYPIAIEASKILGEDEELRAQWEEKFSHLAPLPDSFNPEFHQGDMLKSDKRVWVNAVGDFEVLEKKGITQMMRPSVSPVREYDLVGLESEYTNPEWYEIARNSVELMMERMPDYDQSSVGEMSGSGALMAKMGLGDHMRNIIVNQIHAINADREYCYYYNNGRQPVYENRLTSREGVNAMSAQRLANVANALQNGLIQSSGGAPTAEPVLRLFPAMPSGWNTHFLLHAKAGFRVEAAWEDGKITLARITSERGKDLRVRNPWGEAEVKITVNGTAGAGLRGSLLTVQTNPGDVIELSKV